MRGPMAMPWGNRAHHRTPPGTCPPGHEPLCPACRTTAGTCIMNTCMESGSGQSDFFALPRKAYAGNQDNW